MSYLIDRATKTMTPGAMMVLFLSEEMDTGLHLPEIYKLLGEDLAMVFLEVFGGRKIELPDVRQVRSAYHAVTAYLRVEELMKVNSEGDAVAQAAVELKMTPKQTMANWRRVKAMVVRLDEAVQDAIEGQ